MEVGSGVGRGNDWEKNTRGAFSLEKVEITLLTRSPEVEGHVEWHKLDQR